MKDLKIHDLLLYLYLNLHYQTNIFMNLQIILFINKPFHLLKIILFLINFYYFFIFTKNANIVVIINKISSLKLYFLM